MDELWPRKHPLEQTVQDDKVIRNEELVINNWKCSEDFLCKNISSC